MAPTEAVLPADDAPSTPVAAPSFTAPLGRIPDDQVRSASAAVEHSGLLNWIEEWREEERSGPGGRPETFPTKALLVAMALGAADGQSMLATSFTQILFRRTPPALRHELGVPKPPAPDDNKGWDNCYRNVRTRLHRLFDLMDPCPTPKNRRYDPATFDALLEQRRAERSPEEWAEREQRLIAFTNQVLEMGFGFLPREVRRAWKGSAAVDATVIPTFARPARRERRTRRASSPRRSGTRPIPTPSGTTGTSGRGHGESDPTKSIWGYEATLVVAGNDDPKQPAVMPSLVFGMALHKPGHEVGQNAIRALASVSARKHPAGLLARSRLPTVEARGLPAPCPRSATPPCST